MYNKIITSYGMCCFNITDRTNPKLCIVESDYTFAFRDLVNCKYNISDLNNDNFMETNVYGKMSIYEKKLILLRNFKILSVLSWNIGYNNYISNYDSIEKKEELFNKYIFNDEARLLRLICNSNNHYSETEILKQTISIPKGRKRTKTKEEDYKVAIREFSEETNIFKFNLITSNNKTITVPKNINNVSYNNNLTSFRYTNDANYDTVYYIGFVSNNLPCVYNHNSPDQFREIKNIRWVTESQLKDRYGFLSKTLTPAFDYIHKYINSLE